MKQFSVILMFVFLAIGFTGCKEEHSEMQTPELEIAMVDEKAEQIANMPPPEGFTPDELLAEGVITEEEYLEREGYND